MQRTSNAEAERLYQSIHKHAITLDATQRDFLQLEKIAGLIQKSDNIFQQHALITELGDLLEKVKRNIKTAQAIEKQLEPFHPLHEIYHIKPELEMFKEQIFPILENKNLVESADSLIKEFTKKNGNLNEDIEEMEAITKEANLLFKTITAFKSDFYNIFSSGGIEFIQTNVNEVVPKLKELATRLKQLDKGRKLPQYQDWLDKVETTLKNYDQLLDGIGDRPADLYDKIITPASKAMFDVSNECQVMVAQAKQKNPSAHLSKKPTEANNLYDLPDVLLGEVFSSLPVQSKFFARGISKRAKVAVDNSTNAADLINVIINFQPYDIREFIQKFIQMDYYHTLKARFDKSPGSLKPLEYICVALTIDDIHKLKSADFAKQLNELPKNFDKRLLDNLKIMLGLVELNEIEKATKAATEEALKNKSFIGKRQEMQRQKQFRHGFDAPDEWLKKREEMVKLFDRQDKQWVYINLQGANFSWSLAGGIPQNRGDINIAGSNFKNIKNLVRESAYGHPIKIVSGDFHDVDSLKLELEQLLKQIATIEDKDTQKTLKIYILPGIIDALNRKVAMVGKITNNEKKEKEVLKLVRMVEFVDKEMDKRIPNPHASTNRNYEELKARINSLRDKVGKTQVPGLK